MSPQRKLISWNVNGIRAAHKKGFMDWFNTAQADIVALQETRALVEQLPKDLQKVDGYHTYWFPAEKKGYSGVGLLTREEPLNIFYGLGDPTYDVEGRVLVAEYDAFYLLNTYFPSGSRDLSRVEYKLAFNEVFLDVAEKYRAQKPVVFCGDVNIAHNEIDLTHAKANQKNSGFLPEERAWLDKLMGMGYVDTFRHLYPDVAETYSWWTARGGARPKNVGWRIDYFIMTDNLLPALVDATILTDVMGSDHCPVSLELDLDKL